MDILLTLLGLGLFGGAMYVLFMFFLGPNR